MGNPLFGLLNRNQPMNILDIMNMLQQNPMTVLQKAGLNLPNNLNNPDEIVRFLLQSGQINQAQLNQAQQMARFFRR